MSTVPLGYILIVMIVDDNDNTMMMIMMIMIMMIMSWVLNVNCATRVDPDCHDDR